MGHSENHEHHEHHLTPIPVLVKTFIALIFLTVITVGVSYIELGNMAFLAAMFIASIKCGLVMMIFMGLRWDNLSNNVAIFSAFVFVLIFIFLTAADLWFREDITPVAVVNTQVMEDKGDPNILRNKTDDLIAQGKVIYEQQCTICHGSGGLGDGPGAAALNPKPRNFVEGKWQRGGSPTRMFESISNGFAKMPGFKDALTTEQRYAVVHYVRTFNDNNPDDTEADLKAAGLLGGGKKEKKTPAIPIAMALENMAEPDNVILPAHSALTPQGRGAKLYNAYCAQCHGGQGQGAQVSALGVNPRAAITTRTFKGSGASWVGNQSTFVSIVSKGLPGKSKPGLGGFTKGEWTDLYAYARSLAR